MVLQALEGLDVALCKKCKSYGVPSPASGRRRSVENEQFAECRLSEPGAYDYDGNTVQWPVVHESDWCRKFEAKEN